MYIRKTPKCKFRNKSIQFANYYNINRGRSKSFTQKQWKANSRQAKKSKLDRYVHAPLKHRKFFLPAALFQMAEIEPWTDDEDDETDDLQHFGKRCHGNDSFPKHVLQLVQPFVPITSFFHSYGCGWWYRKCSAKTMRVQRKTANRSPKQRMKATTKCNVKNEPSLSIVRNSSFSSDDFLSSSRNGL